MTDQAYLTPALEVDESESWQSKVSGWWAHLGLAVVVFVPLLLTRPGRVASDTRQYFYVDAGKFMSRALSVWDPNVSMGTVTHSNVGNLFPTGAFFWITQAVGLPAWISQRLWIGLVLFAAGAGVLAFARAINWRGVGPVVAAFAYMLTPYTLQYATRTSVLLLPFAALPWLIAFTDRALRQRGWKYPAFLALLAFAASGANPSAFLMVVPGAALWIAFALVRRDVSLRDAAVMVGRTLILAVGTCALWIVSLLVEGKYGLNVLLFTETLPQVAVAATAMEMFRGLGYWLFYGEEARDPNVTAARAYLTRIPLLLVSYALPMLAVVAALITRWRYRALSIALVLTGVVLGVGTYPYGNSSPFGNAFETVAGSGLGLALRSSARAVPLTALGLALLLGAGADALASRGRRIALLTLFALVGATIINLSGLFTGGFVDPNFSRPEALPAAWTDAAKALDGQPNSRVLEVPGSQFAAYRWGITYDTPILPTLLSNRPSVAREQLPSGSAASADLLGALDRRIQDGTFEPESLAPIARYLGVGDVVIRSDLAFERYSTPRPRTLWQTLGGTVPGLGPVTAFGSTAPNLPDPRIPQDDPIALGTPAIAPDPPEVAVRPVDDPQPIVRSVTGQSPVILVGDGEGVVDAAAAGLVAGDELLLLAPWLTAHPDTLHQALDKNAVVVVTDTNRRRDRRWRSLIYTTGLTDRIGILQPRTGQGEAQLDEFPGNTDDDRSVTVTDGGTIDATRYGGLITFDPDQRAAAAVDGDTTTAWQVDDLTNPIGQSLTLRLSSPVTASHIDLLQSQVPLRTRAISDVTLTFDGTESIPITLTDASRSGTGQRIDFLERTFNTLSITIDGVTISPSAASQGISRTGFAEVRIPDVEISEVIRTPISITSLLRGQSLNHQLSYVLTRSRSNPADTTADRRDEELSLLRQIDVPDTRSFALTGTARLSGRAPESLIDQLLSITASGGTTATSSDHLSGAIDQRANAAIDGDPTTFWSGDVLASNPRSIVVKLPTRQTIDHLNLQIVADGHHSVPTRLRLIGDDGTTRVVDLPPIAEGANQGSVTTVPLQFAPITTSSLTVELSELRTVNTIDTASGVTVALPPAIAELGIAGVAATPPQAIDTGCRIDLLTVDRKPIAIRIAGDVSTALQRRSLSVASCDGPLLLTTGSHRIAAARGTLTGLDLDRLTLTSDAGGAAASIAPDGQVAPIVRTPAPAIDVNNDNATTTKITIPETSEGFWLVLGQSYSIGWNASLHGHSLGAPVLVDGYANGWWVPAGTDAGTVTVTWTPQRYVWAAFALTLLTVVACIILALRRRRDSVGTEVESTDARFDLFGIRQGPSVDWRLSIATGLGIAIAGFVLVGPIGAAIGLAVGVVATAWRYGRIVLAICVLASLGTAVANVIWVQHREHRPVRYDWARGFETEHRLALTGLVLLAADPAVAAVRRRATRPAQRSPKTEPTTD